MCGCFFLLLPSVVFSFGFGAGAMVFVRFVRAVSGNALEDTIKRLLCTKLAMVGEQSEEKCEADGLSRVAPEILVGLVHSSWTD